jgi:L,D-transpeptidase catalytic domain/Bacterial Ig-like domain
MRRRKRHKLAAAGAIAAAIAVLAGIAGLALTAGSSHRRHAPGPAQQRHAQRASGPTRVFRVLSVSPSAGATRVSGDTAVQITFSASVAWNAAVPKLRPKLSGRWQEAGSILTFIPDSPLSPSTRYTVRIPAGAAGVRSTAGGRLGKPIVVRFSTAGYSQLRLDQLLSTLGYLPLSWQPSGRITTDSSPGRVATQKEMAYNPPLGAFTWQPGYPAILHSQWQLARLNPLIRGAVMAFKAQHHMAATPLTGRTFWRELFAAARAGQSNAFGYTYAVARKGSPETLTIWHNGRVVLNSLASTGTAMTPTWPGTFPVYLRHRYQIMRGTYPDGRRYADPVAFVAYFNGGEAVHYFPRASYGFPQSLGCVELPYSQAQRAWPYLTYGSLVSVTG